MIDLSGVPTGELVGELMKRDGVKRIGNYHDEEFNWNIWDHTKGMSKQVDSGRIRTSCDIIVVQGVE